MKSNNNKPKPWFTNSQSGQKLEEQNVFKTWRENLKRKRNWNGFDWHLALPSVQRIFNCRPVIIADSDARTGTGTATWWQSKKYKTFEKHLIRKFVCNYNSFHSIRFLLESLLVLFSSWGCCSSCCFKHLFWMEKFVSLIYIFYSGHHQPS